MMFGEFTLTFGTDFIIAGLILIIGEIISLVVFNKFNTSDLKEYFEDEFKEIKT